ncbi:MAG: NifB/NifX family molybdenum-iron cluster-binding protein [Anaerolineae bacterium]|nr:NifB/NifX family molybdenum-iron cluster-binding protein [Anaerolineae bacterium]
MRIVIPANGTNLDAPISPVFGRCPTFIFVDTDTMAFEAVPNPAINAPGGAGTQAAPMVVQHGAQAILSNPLGPNALRVVQAAGIPIYEVKGATVRQAVSAFIAGEATPVTAPTNTPIGDHFHRGQNR